MIEISDADSSWSSIIRPNQFLMTLDPETVVTLKPNNPDFKPIELTCEEEGQVQVIAELVEVLG